MVNYFSPILAYMILVLTCKEERPQRISQLFTRVAVTRGTNRLTFENTSDKVSLLMDSDSVFFMSVYTVHCIKSKENWEPYNMMLMRPEQRYKIVEIPERITVSKRK